METWIVKLCTVGVPDRTGRVFTREQLFSLTEEVRRNVENRSLMGELGTPVSAGFVHFNKVSHLVVDLYLHGDDFMAWIEIVDTPCGRILKQLKESNVAVNFVMDVCATTPRLKISQIYAEGQ